MALESNQKKDSLILKFNDDKTKNSISADDWIEFRKEVINFGKSDLKYLVLSEANGNFSSGAQLGENLNALMDDVTAASQALVTSSILVTRSTLHFIQSILRRARKRLFCLFQQGQETLACRKAGCDLRDLVIQKGLHVLRFAVLRHILAYEQGDIGNT